MEKKKNIISLGGIDRVGVMNELNRFISAFRDRQSDTNIEMIELSDGSDLRNFEQMALSLGLFSEKRLFIVKGEFREKKGKKGPANDIGKNASILIKILENIDGDTFIIFVLDGEIEKSLDLWLKNHADTRMFQQIFSKEIWQKRYQELDENTIHKVLHRYEELYQLYEDSKKPQGISFLIRETFEKLSLLEKNLPIDEKIILESIDLESSGKIFDFIDAILSRNTKKSLELFQTLKGEANMSGFLPSFIGLLRGSVYVRYLKQKGIGEGEILKILKLHPYVVKKAMNSMISWEILRDFYDKIVETNISYRSGKGLHDSELGSIFGIERALMSLKK